MRAAILHAAGATPAVGTFDEPESSEDGQAVVDVLVAGMNPVDLTMASGQMGEPVTPSVVGREGVGRLPDSRRVYFTPSISPYGSWAERTLIDPAVAFDVPEGLDDRLAVTMGIAGLAAWLSLTWQARTGVGDRVLVLGASGVVGQIAVQGAKVLGARVVAAARSPESLDHATELGADATVRLGGEDDAAALRDAAGDGYDVVIDPVYGPPFLAALAASADGARLVTIGQSAAPAAEIPFRALQGRTHIGHGNRTTPLEVRRDAYTELAGHAAEGRIRVEVEEFPLDRAPDAWEGQRNSPHHKLVVVP